MKTTLKLIFASILTLTFAGSKVCSQTVAIGHVTAEVIESISAASMAVTNFELAMISPSDKRAMNQNYLTSETVNLGSITLNSGRDITCNVVVKSASLSDSSGNDFTLDPIQKNNSSTSVARSNGSRTIQLEGKTNMSSDQASGQYHGSYTVVFAYN
jgi:hypothetical protein